MKHDLLQAYFERDLTAAEEGHLARILQESSEAASQFAALAEKEYGQSGYPKPRAPRHWSRARSLAWLGLQLAVAAGLGWWVWRCQQAGPVSPAGTSSAPAISLQPAGNGETEAPVSRPPSGQETRPRVYAPAAKKASKPPLDIYNEEAAEETRPQPARLDVGVEAGNHFKMVVELGKNAPVDLGITDSSGRPGRTLYRGNLYAGRWSFEWDGRLGDGQKAAPGRYKVNLAAGQENLSRWVEIEKVEIQGIKPAPRRP
jgi:hypothetical protein